MDLTVVDLRRKLAKTKNEKSSREITISENTKQFSMFLDNF